MTFLDLLLQSEIGPRLIELAEKFEAIMKAQKEENMNNQQAFDAAMNCGDFYKAAEIAERMTAKPERSNCVRCGDPLFGLAVALCDECQEESSKEIKDAYDQKEDEDESPGNLD